MSKHIYFFGKCSDTTDLIIIILPHKCHISEKLSYKIWQRNLVRKNLIYLTPFRIIAAFAILSYT
jgi:hypothetical protein